MAEAKAKLPKCERPGCIAWTAKYRVEYRGTFVEHKTVCGHHLPWAVDMFWENRTPLPAICHVEYLRSRKKGGRPPR